MAQCLKYNLSKIRTIIHSGNYLLLKNNEIINILKNDYQIPFVTANNKEIKAIDFSKLNEYLKNGYFIFKTTQNKKCIAINNTTITHNNTLIDEIEKIDAFLVSDSDFYRILERDFADENTKKSMSYLDQNTQYFSAKSINYLKTITGFAIIFLASLAFFLQFFNVINNIFYFLQNLLKAVLFYKGMSSPTQNYNIVKEDLPIYSILVPLYHEAIKVPYILKAIEKLDYPKDKLDVKFILEADDQLTINALSLLNIPEWVHVIKVPYSIPRTKPKALNYAMSFIRGTYLTIYDAEDEPEPDQLLKAITAFRHLPEEYVCIQAKLNFYNAHENLLTYFFSLEYSIWFEYLLKGLSSLNLPVTLGGTSNHFKVDKLQEVGFWDAYNVTEDADLGIRLYLAGYKVNIIDSITFEEAPNNLIDWIAQRTRWIKGFIQTFCVFIKTQKDYKVFTLYQTVTVYIFVGLSTYSFFFLPWLILILFVNLPSIIYYLWIVNGFFAVSYMYIIVYIILSRNKTQYTLKPLKIFLIFILWPFYFILHSVASYMALWEIIRSPFKWNKTPHGNDMNQL